MDQLIDEYNNKPTNRWLYAVVYIRTDTVPVNSKNKKIMIKKIVVEPAAMYW